MPIGESISEQRVCIICGELFKPFFAGHPQKTCSPECSDENKRRISLARYRQRRAAIGRTVQERAKPTEPERESITGDPWLDLYYAIVAFCYRCGRHLGGKQVCECGWTWEEATKKTFRRPRKRRAIRARKHSREVRGGIDGKRFEQ